MADGDTLPHPGSIGTRAIYALGAILDQRGAAFDVWAPFADRVSVTGSSCDWSDPGSDPGPSDAGVWRGYVTGAVAGDGCKYRVLRGEESLLKNDPSARAIKPATRNGVIVDDRFDWGADAFTLSPVEALVIYEPHIGTFNGRGKAAGSSDPLGGRVLHAKALRINAIELLAPAELPKERSWG